jgi:site-specific DNA-methyltransferase (adenine-specific)
MTPTFEIENVRLFLADSMDALPHVGLVESIVTDPPYGLSFMGRKWDYDVPTVDLWTLALECLRPGGHLLAFAGTRTQHRMAVRIEDAGFEIRDMIAWVYGSGFPKSLDVSKAIDDAVGAVREVVGPPTLGGQGNGNAYGEITRPPITAPATDAARQWSGWGTALKPALEPITVARRPLDGTVAENVLAHGTGALNVDGCRVECEANRPLVSSNRRDGSGVYRDGLQGSRRVNGGTVTGRWPANLIHDGSEEVAGLFPQTTSGQPMNRLHTDPGRSVASGASGGGTYMHTGFGDSGSAARFFYCAKASKQDRDEGLDGFALKQNEDWPQSMDGQDARGAASRRNTHPTVKPTDLMRYLCRLVTRPGGIVLDPFMGSGSTGKAAVLEGFGFVGIERDPDHFEIAKARILDAIRQRDALRQRDSRQLDLRF